ncbi:hypothetical protein CEXT_739381 [Caerostris extrusa]|uniref:Uncharacterized protein n=1 Tax=Caerostris extrusa TaxID=172846 RepID=A0AAV4R0T7_CAEEX|nr:hypothetical protein CEXT_739381 [Caerostris extrusa]
MFNIRVDFTKVKTSCKPSNASNEMIRGGVGLRTCGGSQSAMQIPTFPNRLCGSQAMLRKSPPSSRRSQSPIVYFPGIDPVQGVHRGRWERPPFLFPFRYIDCPPTNDVIKRASTGEQQEGSHTHTKKKSFGVGRDRFQIWNEMKFEKKECDFNQEFHT